MKTVLTGLALVLIAGAEVAANKAHHAADAKAIAAALADPARADQAKDDARRRAATVIAFSGVGAGDQVIDFLPGEGYWTRIFTGVVGAGGHVYAQWPQAAATHYAKQLSALQGVGLKNVTAEALPHDTPEAPASVDLFWTVQNYHDILNMPGGAATAEAFDAAVFKVLKPGGTFVVIDHADAPGSGVSGTSTKHRIDPAVVKAEVLKAGFVFAGESDVLRNPADDHSLKVFDPAIRGHTDQFAYKFRKP